MTAQIVVEQQKPSALGYGNKHSVTGSPDVAY
jgi:hypothetical protein